jgi:NADPH:quinone reductase-like Zn-dependent oxidoreductase
MKVAAFAQPGGPEVLGLMDFPDPQAQAGQVRVRVRAAGVQPYDTAVRRGWVPPGAPPGLPKVPGNEFAGIVDQIGDAVTDRELGAEVLGFGQLNAYAEYIVVPASQVTAKPAEMSWEQAGGFTAGAQTAHIALGELAVGSGDTLLIHGAAGSVGTMATQLARLAGATVIGTAAPANHDYLRSLGVIPVAYGEGLVDRVRALAPQGVDAVFDAAGQGALPASIELRGGTTDRIVTIADPTAASLGVEFSAGGPPRIVLADGLRITVAGTFPLGEAGRAQEQSATGHTRGKLVIHP